MVQDPIVARDSLAADEETHPHVHQGWESVEHRARKSRLRLRARSVAGGTSVPTHGTFSWHNWFGLYSTRVPSSAARDFLARERNQLSWVKFFITMALLSCIMFLRIQLKGIVEEHDAQHANTALRIPAVDTVFQAQVNDAFYTPLPEQRSAKDRATAPTDTQGRVLGSIYLVVAFIAFAASTYDYFTCTAELEDDKVYLDEAEGHTSPVVTLAGVFIALVIFATTILLLVQRNDT
ncbi:hypothetical protein MVES_002231 [Malassezia vespertilionis]|uniref:DUF202 domain-containing protein n=1 Tax=Malassezia vespertilionis TaxID=2020962 RepID=A0A2N1JBV5_9BASI|nr:hypothetical protein MVES_002231 [Malassezia vespertilionis]